MKKEITQLSTLIEKYFEKVDEEMEHGCYGTPDCIPYQFQDEEDYYGNHEKIVDEVVELRNKIRKLLKGIDK